MHLVHRPSIHIIQDDANEKLVMHVLGIVEFPAANAMATESLGVTALQNAYCSILDLLLQGAATEATASGGRPRQGWQPLRCVLRPMLKKMRVRNIGTYGNFIEIWGKNAISVMSRGPRA